MKKSPFESRPQSLKDLAEKILTIFPREEILEAMSQYTEGYSVTRELSDEKGIYLLEVEGPADQEGVVTEYQYKRRNNSPHNGAVQTVINRVYYQDGVPIGGEPVAHFDEIEGRWVKVDPA